MGLDNREGGKYITILGGKFSQRVQEDTPGAVQRTNKLGKVVFEKYYDSFTGKLIRIRTQDGGGYGKNWVFDFRDNGEVYHLQLSYSNSFATAFLKMLPNVDLSKEMKVSPSIKEVDGKNKSSLFINQDGVAIKHAFTKDQPNGLPPMVEVTIKGEKVWDDTDRLVFLENMVNTVILPKLKAINPNVNTETAPEKAESLESFTADLKAGEEEPF